MGCPSNSIWQDIIDGINTLGIRDIEPKRHDHRDESENSCAYIECLFKTVEDADRFLKSEFKIFRHPILVIPQLPHIDLERQVACHQAIVTFAKVDFDLNEEIESIVSALQLHGDIVDLNFDYFPHFIVPTYTKPKSVSSLVQFNEPKLQIKNGKQILLHAKVMNFIIPVRNNIVNSGKIDYSK